MKSKEISSGSDEIFKVIVFSIKLAILITTIYSVTLFSIEDRKTTSNTDELIAVAVNESESAKVAEKQSINNKIKTINHLDKSSIKMNRLVSFETSDTSYIIGTSLNNEYKITKKSKSLPSKRENLILSNTNNNLYEIITYIDRIKSNENIDEQTKSELYTEVASTLSHIENNESVDSELSSIDIKLNQAEVYSYLQEDNSNTLYNNTDWNSDLLDTDSIKITFTKNEMQDGQEQNTYSINIISLVQVNGIYEPVKISFNTSYKNMIDKLIYLRDVRKDTYLNLSDELLEYIDNYSLYLIQKLISNDMLSEISENILNENLNIEYNISEQQYMIFESFYVISIDDVKTTLSI
jgi:hypothetical protein